jgi:competence protein ComEC
LVIPLIAGIILDKLVGAWLSLPLWVVFIPLVLLPLLRFLPEKSAYSGRWIYGLLLNLFLITSGFLLAGLNKEINHRNHFSKYLHDKTSVISGIVDDEPSERTNSLRFTLKPDVIVNGNLIQKVTGRIMVYASKDSMAKSIRYGDRITFSEHPTAVPGPKNPGEFDFAAYLANKSIYHQIFLKTGRYEIKADAGGNFLQSFAYRIRNGFLELFKETGMEGREYAVAAALLIGYDDLLDPDQRKEFAGSGAMHILCVSGLHVGIIFLLADKLFFFLRKRKRNNWIRPLMILLVIWFYALVTGLAPSVMRASLMFSLVTIGGAMNRKSHTINSISASAFLLLLYNPAIIFDLGFQLSYSAVLGIVILQPHIQKLYLPRNKFVKYFWDIISVSIAAQIATGPISIMYFSQFPNYFLITNLVVIPLAGVLIYSGLAFMLLAKIPFVSEIAGWLLVWEFKFLNFSVAFIEGLPGAVVRGIYLSGQATLLFYFLILLLFAWYLNRKVLYFRLAVVVLILLSIDFSYTHFNRASRNELIVHNIRNHTAISFVEGRNHFLFADSALKNTPAKLSYPLQGYSTRNGLKTSTLIDLSDSLAAYENAIIYRGFLMAGGKRIALISDRSQMPDGDGKIIVDYVVLRANPRVNADDLVAVFPGAVFVIDASSSFRRMQTWKDDFEKLKVPFYSVMDKGALVVKL